MWTPRTKGVMEGGGNNSQSTGGGGAPARRKARRPRLSSLACASGGSFSRSQTLFGNALTRNSCFGRRYIPPAAARLLRGGETEFRESAFPNRVWEREW